MDVPRVDRMDEAVARPGAPEPAPADRGARPLGARPLMARLQRGLRLAGARRATRARSWRGRASLTAREDEQVGLVGAGLSNVEIARRLGLGRRPRSRS